MHLRFPLLFLLVLLSLAVGCPTSGNRGGDDDDASGDDDDSSGDDDDASGDDDDATTPPPPETDCSDGVDNDGDSLVDCADDDCASAQYCLWPFSLQHTGEFDYDASTLAEIGGYEDCVTQFTAPLDMEMNAAEQCPTCDRTFTGPMTYPSDDCPEGDEPRPTAVSYGIVFFTAIQWDIYVEDADGVWTLVGAAFDDGTGTYTHSRTDEVIVDNDGTDVDAGDLETTLSFTPPTD